MGAKVPTATALDMLVAGTEVPENAVRHGGGIEEVRVGSAAGSFHSPRGFTVRLWV